MIKPDLILHNAQIYTVDEQQPWAQAVAIRKHRIIAVGNDQDVLALAGPKTEIIDLASKLALPGLCDAHIHFYNWSVGLRQVQLAGCTSRAEMLERIALASTNLPAGEWLVGQGWNESHWGEIAFPTVQEVDSVTAPDQPALFWRSDVHCAVVNSVALQLAGINADTENPAGGVIERDRAGQPTGILKDLAMGLVTDLIPRWEGAMLDDTLQAGRDQLHSMGITAIHDQRIKGENEGPRMMAAYQRLRQAGALGLRVNCNIAAHDLDHLQGLGLQSGFGDDYLRLGHVKVFADGSLGSRTAWMLAPFDKISPDDPDNYGVCVTPPDEMARDFRQALDLGFPISVHAIGDHANRVCLDIFEELQAADLETQIPNRIEHVQTIDPADLTRLAQLNITASVQPLHVTDDMDTADLLLGERAAQTYAFRSLLKSGARLALGSDGPVADANPFLGFHAALYRQRVDQMNVAGWHTEESLSLAEIVYGYTMGAATAAGWERTIGSISVGKRADLIVLDRNLFELEAEGSQHYKFEDQIAGTQVEMTVFDGKIVYKH